MDELYPSMIHIPWISGSGASWPVAALEYKELSFEPRGDTEYAQQINAYSWFF